MLTKLQYKEFGKITRDYYNHCLRWRERIQTFPNRVLEGLTDRELSKVAGTKIEYSRNVNSSNPFSINKLINYEMELAKKSIRHIEPGSYKPAVATTGVYDGIHKATYYSSERSGSWVCDYETYVRPMSYLCTTYVRDCEIMGKR